MTQSNSYDEDEFWRSEPVEAKASKDSLETYLNRVNATYVKVRSEDAFRPYVQYMIVIGFISFLVAFIVGYSLIPDGQSFSMPFASNDHLSTFANKFEFALILGISAAATVAIVFAALGDHAVQNQNDQLSGLSHEMDHIGDRIASIELEEAIQKREIKMASQQFTSDRFYTRISKDIQEERYDQALSRVEHALEHSPGDTKLWHYKGIALGKGGKFREALGAFEVSSQINASDPILWYNKAVAFAGMKEYSNAVESLNKALELDPKDRVTQEFRNRIKEFAAISIPESFDPTDYSLEFRLPS